MPSNKQTWIFSQYLCINDMFLFQPEDSVPGGVGVNTAANSSSPCKKLTEQELARQEQVVQPAISGTKFTDALLIKALSLSVAFWNQTMRRSQNSPPCQQVLGHQPMGATDFVYLLSQTDLRDRKGKKRGKTGLTTCPSISEFHIPISGSYFTKFHHVTAGTKSRRAPNPGCSTQRSSYERLSRPKTPGWKNPLRGQAFWGVRQAHYMQLGSAAVHEHSQAISILLFKQIIDSSFTLKPRGMAHIKHSSTQNGCSRIQCSCAMPAPELCQGIAGTGHTGTSQTFARKDCSRQNSKVYSGTALRPVLQCWFFVWAKRQHQGPSKKNHKCKELSIYHNDFFK